MKFMAANGGWMQMTTNDILIQIKDLKKYFPVDMGFFTKSVEVVHAVDGISLDIKRGETFGLVGETGSGKSTLGRVVLRLYEPTAGTINFEGNDITNFSDSEMREFRKNMQMIFQDPFASLNPRRRVEEIVGLPLTLHGMKRKMERRGKVIELLERVGLIPGEEFLLRHPHEFSGGQRQRIGVARAIALNPKFIVCDEPVSSLDVSIRAQILNLLQDLKREFDLTYLLIAHDLMMVKYMSGRIMVMYLGRPMELARGADMFSNPQHPYTEALLGAVPVPDPRHVKKRVKLLGEMPSPIHPPQGCRFHTRCPYVKDVCKQTFPDLREVGSNHMTACIRAEEIYGS